MKVSEIFGPTLQGEGPTAGQRAVFLRLGGCNLTCSWCDTAYTWDASRFNLRDEITDLPIEDVVRQLLSSRSERIVVTGGEPLLQERAVVQVLQEVRFAVPHVEIETNGTRAPSEDLVALVDQFNVSPKLAHSGSDPAKAVNLLKLRDFERTGKAVFKFVVRDPADLDEVDQIVLGAHLSNVWLMPEGTTAEAVTDRLRWMCDAAIQRGWNVTSRLHILAWDDRRGR